MEEKLQVGIISSTHGIKGEVKVFPTTDDVSRFKKLKEVILKFREEEQVLSIQGVKFFKKFVILKFKGIDSINDIEKYKGMGLYVPREQAVPLQANEFYIADLLDMDVFLEDGTHFGVLADVMQTGANDVYVVKTKDEKEVLLPAIHDCIRKVDIENRRMTVHVLKGLLD